MTPQEELQALRRLAELEAKGAPEGLDEPPSNQAPSRAAYALDRGKRGVASMGSLVDLMGQMAHPVQDATLASVPEELRARLEAWPSGGPPRSAQDAIGGLLGVKGYAPKDRGDRYLGAAAEAVGASLVPSGVATGLAKGILPKVGVGAAELLASTSSGLTGELGRQTGEETGWFDPRTGEIVGSLLGSSPSVFMSPAIREGVRGTAHKVRGTFSKKAGDVSVGKEIAEAVTRTPAVASNLARAAAIEARIPGVSYTLGQRTGAPSMIQKEKAAQHRTAEALDKATQVYGETAGNIERFADKTFPLGTLPTPARTPFDEKVAARLAGLDDEQKKLAMQYKARPREDVGRRLREIRDERKAVVSGLAQENYNNVYRMADETKVDFSDVRAWVQSLAESPGYKAQTLPATFSKILNKASDEASPILGPGGKKITKPAPFAELHSFLRETRREKRVAEGAGNYPHQSLLADLEDVLEAKVKEAASPDVAAALRDADRFYSREYHDVFRSGLGGELAKKGRLGITTPDGKVVESLVFRRGTTEGVDEFKRLYGDSQDANDLLMDGAYDLFTRYAVRKGAVDPKRAEAFLSTYGDALSKLPQVRANLKHAAKDSSLLAQRQERLLTQKKWLESNTTAKMLEVEDLPNAIEAGMKDRRELSKLVGLAQRKGGMGVLSRSVADHVQGQKDPFGYVLENKDSLARVLGPEHVRNLETLAEAKSILLRNVPEQKISGPPGAGPIEGKLGVSGPSLESRLRSAAEGRISTNYLASSLLGRWLFKNKAEQAQKAFDAAIYDKDLADTLVKMSKTNVYQMRLVKEFRNHAFAAGFRATLDPENPGEGEIER